jgi:hypothetical protein
MDLVLAALTRVPIDGTALGIVVSVLLFLVGYRQTIGARKERIRVANLELQRLAVRRFSSDVYTPTVDDITRTIEAKAREHNLSPAEVDEPQQVLNSVLLSLLESDFLEPVHLETTMTKLHGVISSLVDQSTLHSQNHSDSWFASVQQNSRLISVGVIAALGGIVAVLIAAGVSQDVAIGTLVVQLLLTVAAATLGILFVLARQTSTIPSDELPLFRAERVLQREALKLITDRKIPIISTEPEFGPADVILQCGKQVVAVDLKAVSDGRDIVLSNSVRTLDDALPRYGASLGLIVTNRQVRVSPTVLNTAHVEVTSIESLGSVLDKYMDHEFIARRAEPVHQLP